MATALFGATTAFAQLTLPLPPSSAGDGVTPASYGMNAGPTRWDAVPGIRSYKFESNANYTEKRPGTPDNVLGLNWGSAAPSRSAINAEGGLVRVIFLGESAGWRNDFGYTYSGDPSDATGEPGTGSWTVWENIQAVDTGNNPANIFFGDYFEVALAPGEASTFDLWLNGVGAGGNANPVPPTANGGVYTWFNQTNSIPYNAPGNVVWSQSALQVNTYLGMQGSTAVYRNLPTYLASIEDWRLDTGADRDFTDFMVAVQILSTSDLSFGAIPEPSTYGLIAAAALLGFVGYRRWKGARRTPPAPTAMA